MPAAPRHLAEVARSVDAPRALLPVLPDLLRGLDALGSMPSVVVRELDRAGVGPRHRVLDLACGKGAVTVELAQRLGCRVIGIDAFGPFIESARDLARRHGVNDRARFRVGPWQDARGHYDAAMMLGLLPLADAARVLRPLTRPGGVYVIDDCWWDPRAGRGHRGWLTREQSSGIILSLGDAVERVVTPTPSTIRRLNTALYAVIAANARHVGREHPRLRPALAEFLASQRHANRLLGARLRPAIWVVRKAGGPRPPALVRSREARGSKPDRRYS